MRNPFFHSFATRWALCYTFRRGLAVPYSSDTKPARRVHAVGANCSHKVCTTTPNAQTQKVAALCVCVCAPMHKDRKHLTKHCSAWSREPRRVLTSGIMFANKRVNRFEYYSDTRSRWRISMYGRTAKRQRQHTNGARNGERT